MFYVRANSREGRPSGLYRTPSEIGRDIVEVRQRICDIEDRLNVRNILAEALPELAMSDPARWIPQLEGIVKEATDLLFTLEGLSDTLDMLMTELEETKCILEK